MADEDDQAQQNLGPIERIQAILAELDPSSMSLGFAVVAEWLEEDGSRSMSLLHTDMSAWHMYGLMTYARESHVSGCDFDIEYVDGEIDDD